MTVLRIRSNWTRTPDAVFSETRIDGDHIEVRFHLPPLAEGEEPPSAVDQQIQKTSLEIPLEPDIEELEPTDVNLYGSATSAYWMGERYDAWFYGLLWTQPARLVFLGDGKRKVLGTMSPTAVRTTSRRAVSISRTAAIRLVLVVDFLLHRPRAARRGPAVDHLRGVAPLLVTSEASLPDVSARLSEGL